MTDSITLKTNQHRLIENLRQAFTQISMLGELMQNARRAGASEVCFEVEGDSIAVIDDGHGIADLQSLLFIAESSWSEEIKQRENPFGMGALSALYFAKKLSVHSLNRRFESTTADIIAGNQITIEACEHRQGTLLRLGGVKPVYYWQTLLQWTREQLLDLSEAFPIPIKLNGEALPRPLADKSLEWRETAVGRVLINLQSPNSDWRCFLQGLPLVDGHSGAACQTVLLNNDMIARLPDRQSLLNTDTDYPQIRAAVEQSYRQALRQERQALSAEDFVLKHGTACLMSDNADLLNELPVALLEWFRDWDENPAGCVRFWDRATVTGLITREEVLERGVWILDDPDDLAAQAYVQARDGLLLTTSLLSNEHWLEQAARVIHLGGISVKHGEILHQERWPDLLEPITLLALVQQLSVQLVGDEREYPVTAVRDGSKVFVTTAAQGVTRWVSDYIVDERHDERSEDDDEELIQVFIAAGRARNAAEVIKALLPLTPMRKAHPGLASATVRLQFDPQGALLDVQEM